MTMESDKHNNIELKNREIRESGPGKRPNFILLTALLCIIILMCIVVYTMTPGYRRNRILKKSSIRFDTTFPDDPSLGVNASHVVGCENGTVGIESRWTDNDGNILKSGEGFMSGDRYLDLFTFLQDFKASKEGSDLLIVTLGNSRKEIHLDENQSGFLRDKFSILNDEYIKDTNYAFLEKNPGMKVLAGNIDPLGNLGVTEVFGAILYNRADGEMAGYLLGSGSEFELGRLEFIATNFEGMGLVVRDGNTLGFWEKKYLRNLMVEIAGEWETAPEYEEVLVSKGAVFFMAPDGKGRHNLTKYDYENRKTAILMESTDMRLKDITPDGKFLLITGPEVGKTAVINTVDGQEYVGPLSVDPGDFPRIFSFFGGPGDFILSGDGKIELRKTHNGKVITSIIEKDSRLIQPIEINNSQDTLVYVDTQSRIYYLHDLKTGKSLGINQTPMTVNKLKIGADRESVYFFLVDDLYVWSAPGREEKKVDYSIPGSWSD